MTESISYYVYSPSPALAGVVAGLYGLCFLVTLYLIIRKRAWVWLVMLVGIAMEVVGYAARVVSAKNVTDKPPYVLQFTLIILAPVLMAGVIYVLFSRIVFWVLPAELRTFRFVWVPPRFITPLFVGFDILSLLLQLVAAVLIAGTDPTDSDAKQKVQLGKDLGMAGVSVQLAGFGLFTISAVRFHFASRKVDPDFARMNKSKNGIKRDWPTLLMVINASCILILVRSVYRMVEFSEGKTGKTQQAEWYLYVFDCLPIFLVAVLYIVWFPGNFLKFLGFRLPKEHRELPSDLEATPMTTMAPSQASSRQL